MPNDHDLASHWLRKAKANQRKWGKQDLKTLCVVATEELGEISQAVLDAIHSDGDGSRIREEVDDLAAVCFQLQWAMDCHEGTGRADG